MREGPIERHLCNLVSKAGGRAYKWVSPGNTGVPDRLVFLHGVVFFVETKSTTGRLRFSQKVQHKALAALGHHTVVLSSKEQVEDWVEMQSGAFKGSTIHFGPDLTEDEVRGLAPLLRDPVALERHIFAGVRAASKVTRK